MRYPFMFIAGLALLGFLACKKSSNNTPSDSRTMANMAGTYDIVSVDATLGGIPANDYIPACDKDNKVVLTANGNAQFVDAGVVCTPASDSTGSWHLSSNADSIYLGNQANFIQSFDGKKLVAVTTGQALGQTAVLTTTLTKE